MEFNKTWCGSDCDVFAYHPKIGLIVSIISISELSSIEQIIVNGVVFYKNKKTVTNVDENLLFGQHVSKKTLDDLNFITTNINNNYTNCQQTGYHSVTILFFTKDKNLKYIYENYDINDFQILNHEKIEKIYNTDLK